MAWGIMPGQEGIWKRLQRELERGRPAPAYLFSGPEGVGKRLLAERWSAALLCAQEGSGAPCGECRSCRLLAAGGHPHFHLLQPEREGSLGLAAIRRLAEELWRSAPGYQVAVLDHAEALTLEAQNAMLKLLEEPPPRTCQVLLTARPEALLSTVRSRCREIKFGPLPRRVVIAWLEERGYSVEEAMGLAALAGGSLTRAASLCQERVREWRERALELLLQPRLHRLLSWEEVKDRELAETILDFCAFWVRDLLLYQLTQNRQELLNRDREETFWEEVQLAPEYLLAAGELLQRARQWLRSRVRPAACLEGLVVGLMEERRNNGGAGGRNPLPQGG
ncbi:DNA polymerase III subunit [Desulfothermobacter acidiphilus]|uniref:DNA polymerase III subunit n=1 Tax=Desulfothermobacter acidiphilus TaxID=1938353 RepID=UPI003F8C42BD